MRACRGLARASPAPPPAARDTRAARPPQSARPPPPTPRAAGGQESAGIASYNGDTGMYVQKGMGLVSQVFNEADMDTLKGA